MPKKKDDVDVIIHTIDDFESGDVIEFIHPTGSFAVGKFIKVIKHRTGNRRIDIELKTAGGKIIITEDKIRWDRTIFHKNRTGSKIKCQIKLST